MCLMMYQKEIVGEQIHITFLGIIEVNINGFTPIKLLDVSIQRKNDKQYVRGWSMTKMETFKNMFDLSNISAIIIDEISTIQAYMLGYINVHLQEGTQKYNAPFGGIALVMIGDFDQLPPVVE